MRESKLNSIMVLEPSHWSFILNFSYRGRLAEVKQQISGMAINGSGIRDPARVLKVSRTTVIKTLKI